MADAESFRAAPEYTHARLKPAWAPNLFCALCRKGSGFDVAVRSFVCSPLEQLHPRNVVALEINFTLSMAMSASNQFTTTGFSYDAGGEASAAGASSGAAPALIGFSESETAMIGQSMGRLSDAGL